MTRQRALVDTIVDFPAGACGPGALAVRRSLPSPTTSAESHSAAALIDTTAADGSRDALRRPDGAAEEPSADTRSWRSRAVRCRSRSTGRASISSVDRTSDLEVVTVDARGGLRRVLMVHLVERCIRPWSRPTTSDRAGASSWPNPTPTGPRADAIKVFVPCVGAGINAAPKSHTSTSDLSSRGCIASTMSTPSKLSSTAAYVVAHEALPRPRVNDSATAMRRTQTCRYRNEPVA